MSYPGLPSRQRGGWIIRSVRSRGPAVATSTLRPSAGDMVVPVEITPGGLNGLLELFGEHPNPLIKYRNGKVLLVSPGEAHGRAVRRLDVLLLAFCTALRVGFRGYRSTLFRKPG